MQRFHHAPTQNAATTPVYDSETVRDVLARAAQIEQETQTDAPMTAEQIETLGRELGMSPDAVQRALDERQNVVPIAVASANVLSSPITRADVITATKTALIPNAVIGVGMALMMLVTEGLSKTGLTLTQNVLGVALALLVLMTTLWGLWILPFLYGRKRQDWRQGLLFGSLILPIFTLTITGIYIVTNMITAALIPLNWNSPWGTAVAPLILGIAGGIVGKRDAERKRHKNR